MSNLNNRSKDSFVSIVTIVRDLIDVLTISQLFVGPITFSVLWWPQLPVNTVANSMDFLWINSETQEQGFESCNILYLNG